MSEPSTNSGGIPSSAYTHDYYVNCCDGYAEFSASRGDVLPRRLQLAYELAGVRAGMHILDIGCGRGELLIHAARQGATATGLDYAAAAVAIARDAVADVQTAAPIHVLQSSSLYLPFAENSIDCIFMLDVVEHLLPAELDQTLRESLRVLKPGGRMVIHTMPNLWYYHLGYPVYRGLQRLRGQRLPANPRERWAYHHVHVNEQTPTRLYQSVKAAGFATRVWLQSTQSYEYETNQLVRWGMTALVSVYPFRWIFCNDIFAVGVKR